MGPPLDDDPCYRPVVRLPLPGGRGRIRVVELLATGTNGGAQEHVFNLVSRIDRERYDVSVCALSPGSAVRKLERAGIPVCVIDAPDDDAATEALAAHLGGGPGGRRPQPHVPGRDRRDAGRLAGRRGRPAAAVRRGDRPLVARPVGRGPGARPAADAADGPPHRGLHLDRPQDRRRGAARGAGHASSTTGWTCSATTSRCRAARSARNTACRPRARWSGSWRASRRRRATRPSSTPGRSVLAEFPDATLLVVGEGSRREALEAQVAALGISRSVVFTGRRDDVPAVTAALDVAVLPSYREAQGLTILEAMALSRPVVASNVGGIPEMIEDGRTGLLVPPHDPAALAASHHPAAPRPPAGRHARAHGTRPGPRALLRGADGPRGRDDLRRVPRPPVARRSPGRTFGPLRRLGRGP